MILFWFLHLPQITTFIHPSVTVIIVLKSYNDMVHIDEYTAILRPFQFIVVRLNQDDKRMIMKCIVKCNLVYSWKDYGIPLLPHPSPPQTHTPAGIEPDRRFDSPRVEVRFIRGSNRSGTLYQVLLLFIIT